MVVEAVARVVLQASPVGLSNVCVPRPFPLLDLALFVQEAPLKYAAVQAPFTVHRVVAEVVPADAVYGGHGHDCSGVTIATSQRKTHTNQREK